jgi:hypothetical protein
MVPPHTVYVNNYYTPKDSHFTTTYCCQTDRGQKMAQNGKTGFRGASANENQTGIERGSNLIERIYADFNYPSISA